MPCVPKRTPRKMCIRDSVTYEELSAYGLDEARRVTAEATYKDAQSGEKETFTVYIGKMSEDGTSRYVMAVSYTHLIDRRKRID